MAPRGAAANISFTVDSASEDETPDELNTLATPDSNTENKAPARRGRGKAAAKPKEPVRMKAPAKSKTTTRRVSGGSALGAKKQSAGVAKKMATKTGRRVLAERPAGNNSDTEEVDEFDGEDEVAAPAAEVKTARRGRPPKAKKAQEGEELQEEAASMRGTRKTATKEPTTRREVKTKPAVKSRPTKRVPELEPEPEREALTILETQQDPEADRMDIEPSIEVEEIPESLPPPPRPSARRAQQQPRPARQTSAGQRRAGSVSDTERDPALRRKLGELTKKLEAMTTKYETLKEAASSGRESNFEQLKKRTEQTAKDQDAVIKALKQQISETQSRSGEMATMRKEMAKLEKENARLASENKMLTDSLAAAQNENKTLSTKLTAARASAPPDTKTAPGSAVKPRMTGVVLPGSAEAAKELQFQKHKVELYSDLTNLVVLGMKKNEDNEDVYDCLQAGRNGTLHFHLTVAAGGESYEETEFIYNPLLNEQRDRELIELLPDYLTEEICFPRAQAPKFYTKVVDSMSKKIILEDE